MGEDKYLERFNSILKDKEISEQNKSKVKYQQEYKKAIKNLKEGSIHGKSISANPYFTEYIAKNTVDWIQDRGKGWVTKFADEGFKNAIARQDISMAINAYKIYENLGRSNSSSVKKRLLKALESCPRCSKDDIEFVENSLKRNLSSSLESKSVASIFGIATAVGILFGLNSMTGAAIGFSNAPSGFLGAVLFIGGIAGLYFSLK